MNKSIFKSTAHVYVNMNIVERINERVTMQMCNSHQVRSVQM